MLEKLMKNLVAITPKARPSSYAPPDAVRIGPPIGEPPRSYMNIWLEKCVSANSTKENARVCLEFRNVPGCVTRFDAKAIPELLVALAQFNVDLQKEKPADVPIN